MRRLPNRYAPAAALAILLGLIGSTCGEMYVSACCNTTKGNWGPCTEACVQAGTCYVIPIYDYQNGDGCSRIPPPEKRPGSAPAGSTKYLLGTRNTGKNWEPCDTSNLEGK
jgi:hypothetical protein